MMMVGYRPTKEQEATMEDQKINKSVFNKPVLFLGQNRYKSYLNYFNET